MAPGEGWGRAPDGAEAGDGGIPLDRRDRWDSAWRVFKGVPLHGGGSDAEPEDEFRAISESANALAIHSIAVP